MSSRQFFVFYSNSPQTPRRPSLYLWRIELYLDPKLLSQQHDTRGVRMQPTGTEDSLSETQYFIHKIDLSLCTYDKSIHMICTSFICKPSETSWCSFSASCTFKGGNLSGLETLYYRCIPDGKNNLHPSVKYKPSPTKRTPLDLQVSSRHNDRLGTTWNS